MVVNKVANQTDVENRSKHLGYGGTFRGGIPKGISGRTSGDGKVQSGIGGSRLRCSTTTGSSAFFVSPTGAGYSPAGYQSVTMRVVYQQDISDSLAAIGFLGFDYPNDTESLVGLDMTNGVYRSGKDTAPASMPATDKGVSTLDITMDFANGRVIFEQAGEVANYINERETIGHIAGFRGRYEGVARVESNGTDDEIEISQLWVTMQPYEVTK